MNPRRNGDASETQIYRIIVAEATAQKHKIISVMQVLGDRASNCSTHLPYFPAARLGITAA